MLWALSYFLSEDSYMTFLATYILIMWVCCNLDLKEIQPVHPKVNQSWIFIGRTDAEAEIPILWPPDGWEELMHLKRPWCWERLRVGAEGMTGRDDWMASPTQWTWVWVNSGSWWWSGRPGVLHSMGSKRVGHDLSDWTDATIYVTSPLGTVSFFLLL